MAKHAARPEHELPADPEIFGHGRYWPHAELDRRPRRQESEDYRGRQRQSEELNPAGLHGCCVLGTLCT